MNRTPAHASRVRTPGGAAMGPSGSCGRRACNSGRYVVPSAPHTAVLAERCLLYLRQRRGLWQPEEGGQK